jgi:UDP-N-acetylglucosamine--N-acetylmuramyl-(pentapeptide) pyrophosphoryl-undecaprenol N-acetylglucosamine transferase
MRKQIVLFEANCQLGKVNRLFSPFAKSTTAQFPLPKGRVELVPLLPWKERSPLMDKAEAKEKYGLNPEKMTCLVFGGSQGASFLNRAVPRALSSSMQAIHLTGKEERVDEVTNLYAEMGISASVRAYESEMERAYAAADFAICRSGASTIAELIGHELPALLIPFPFSSDGHQVANAEFLAKKVGGATMLLEETACQEALLSEVMRLIENRDVLRDVLRVYRKECEGRESFAARIMGER